MKDKVKTYYSIRTTNAKTYDRALAKVEDGNFHDRDPLSDKILTKEELKNAMFPNGFESWMETHHEIVKAISLTPEDAWNKVTNIETTQGTGGLYLFAQELTDKFEELYKNKEWGIDDDTQYFDVIDEFIKIEFNYGEG